MKRKLFGGTIHSALIHAATAYDRKAEARGRGHNPYSLAQYFARIDEVVTDIAAGAAPRDAIVAAFSGTLRTAMLKAIGEAADHRETGAICYRLVKS